MSESQSTGGLVPVGDVAAAVVRATALAILANPNASAAAKALARDAIVIQGGKRDV